MEKSKNLDTLETYQGSPERYPTIYLWVQGGGGGRRRWRGAVAWGSPEKKLGTGGGGLEGLSGRRWTGGGELFRDGEAARGLAVRPVVVGGSGGYRLKMNYRPSVNYMWSASLLPLRSVSTVPFRFHTKFQFRQLSSESTVFTSSVVVRWFFVM